IGLKTGTTSKAGSCLSAAATRDNMTLIAVVMGGADSNSRFMGARKMLDFGFANYGVLSVDAEIGDNTRLKIKGGERSSVPVKADGKLSVLTKKGEPKVDRKLELLDSVKAPIKKGDVVGKVYISVDGEEVGVINIKATESVKKRTVFMMYRWLISAIICKK
ncbi:MAG: D-alanyl-D-alanine carboxypeptidase, partial [Clostridia bacterium]|nr:D-alanyl-D-alanine carboxypeptidase [Clostridia bacterium]